MPAGTVSFDKTKTMWMPAYVYIGCAAPAADAIITVVLNAAGEPTPDSVENPNHIHLGSTDKGTKCSYKWTKVDAFDDEHYAPTDYKMTAEEMTIEGGWKQLLNPTLLQKMSGGGTLTSITGGKLVQFGGIQTMTSQCVVVLSPKKSDPTKIIQFVMFDAYNTEGVEMTNTKDAQAVSPFRFVGQTVTTRALTKQIGYVYVPD